MHSEDESLLVLFIYLFSCFQCFPVNTERGFRKILSRRKEIQLAVVKNAS